MPWRSRAAGHTPSRSSTALPRGETVRTIGTIGVPYAVRSLSAWLGWPPGMEEELVAWIRDNHAARRSGDRTRTAAVAQRFDRMIHALLLPRRGRPATDVTGELMHERVDGRPLTDDEVVSILRNWTAGDLGSLATSVGVIVHFLARNIGSGVRDARALSTLVPVPTLPTPVRLSACLALVALLTAACVGGSSDGGAGGAASVPPERSDEPTTAASPASSEQPLPWGPTEAELARAQELVGAMSAPELAGQVIVGRWHGTDPATAAAMVEDLHLAGVQLTGDNIVDRAQVSATTEAVSEAFARTGRDFPPVIGVDEEGGLVAHLRGITAEYPAFATAGAAVAASGPDGRRAVRAAMRAKAMELRELGFTWVFAPVADVTIGDADVTIGSRSASSEPQVAAAAVSAAVQGYVDAGLVSTTKHFPGHGAATQDSHETLPEIDVTREQLAARDLPPFRAAVRAGAPAVMLGHLDVSSLAPGVPTSLAPQAYDLLRGDLGFQGVAVTDSLGMGAVISRGRPTVEALAAGADLLLMPADTVQAHGVVTRAIRRGELDRARVEEAAARVVAVQMWQRRTSGAQRVPGDTYARAVTAARALEHAAS